MRISILLSFLLVSQAFAFSAGPPDSVVGNPTTCNQCHNSFALNSGAGALMVDGLPTEFYEPGKAYIIEIELNQINQSRFGFEATAYLNNNPNKRAGEIVVLENDLTQVSTSGKDAPQYIKHKRAGTFAGMVKGRAQWVFKWIAPSSGNGEVYFYVACNAASNDNTNQGDYVYTSKYVLKEGKVAATSQPK